MYISSVHNRKRCISPRETSAECKSHKDKTNQSNDITYGIDISARAVVLGHVPSQRLIHIRTTQHQQIPLRTKTEDEVR
jgi:hypothetical protein